MFDIVVLILVNYGITGYNNIRQVALLNYCKTFRFIFKITF